MKKVKLLIATATLSLVALFSSIFAVTGAWFTHISDVETATITVGEAVTLTIQGTFGEATILPGDFLDNFISAYAKAADVSSSMYVRAKISTEDEVGENIEVTNAGSNWKKCGNYFYYSTKDVTLTADSTLSNLTVLEQGQSTSELEVDIRVKTTATEETLIPGTTVTFNVVFEAIQSKNTENKTISAVDAAWGGSATQEPGENPDTPEEPGQDPEEPEVPDEPEVPAVNVAINNGGTQESLEFVEGDTIAQLSAKYNSAQNTAQGIDNYNVATQTCGWFYDEALTLVAKDTDVVTAETQLYTKAATLDATQLSFDTSKVGTDGVVYVSKGTAPTGEVVLPAAYEVDGIVYPVTIKTASTNTEGAFLSCSNITSVILPTSLTEIAPYSFNSCEALATINIQNSITSIGSHALYYTGLINVTIPSSVTIIDENAFYFCSKLESVEIAEGVSTIGGGAFYYCQRLTNMELPSTVTLIGASAFASCSKLASINIPSGITSIGNRTFYSCSALQSIEIPYGVTTIGEYAFNGCSNITSIELPSTVISIMAHSFGKCSLLTNIKLSSNLETIGYYAFTNCRKLATIEIPSSVTTIEYRAFSGCRELTSVILKDTTGWYTAEEDIAGNLTFSTNTVDVSDPATTASNFITSGVWLDLYLINKF